MEGNSNLSGAQMEMRRLLCFAVLTITSCMAQTHELFVVLGTEAMSSRS